MEKQSGDVQVLEAIVSVNHAELDRQHKVCADALEKLRVKSDILSLEAVLSAYEEHFAFEESLLDNHLYKNIGTTQKNTGFSAIQDSRRSHYKDHARLIDEIRALLTRMNNEENIVHIASSFVDRVLRNFENHANIYDDSYKDALAAALA